MTSYSCYMKADGRPPGETALDLSPLVGDWINLKSDSRYIVRAILRVESDRLLLKIYGANQPEAIDWGEVEAIPYVMGQAAIANSFYTRYDLKGIKVDLVANQKLGILVIQSYVCYEDGSGRTNHHTRDFFRRQ